MKKIVFILAFALIGLTYNAQAQYEKGQIDANLGVGFGGSFATGSISLPPVSFSLDFGINENISLGGYVGYSASNEDFAGFGANYSWKYTYIIVGVRGAYHIDLVDKMDTYGGLMLGYNVATVKYEGPGAAPVSPSVGGIAYSAFVGARYHFGDSFGVFGELGYGIALLNVGVTMKF